MRTALSTLIFSALATSLGGCLAQPLSSHNAASSDVGGTPTDSVVAAYEAGRQDATTSKRRGGIDIVSWLAFPAGVLAARATGAEWMRAVTALTISGGSVAVAYQRRARTVVNPPDSMRTRWLADDRMWDAYRRGYQVESARGRRADFARASESAGGTILSYGVAPLLTRSSSRP